MSLLKLLALMAVGLGLASCDWISLASNALTYRTTEAGQAGNVAVFRSEDPGGFGGSTAYVTLAQNGFTVVDPSTGRIHKTIPPPEGSDSVDDLSVSGGFLFALDARPPGALSVFDLLDPQTPRLVAGPVAVPVGPFSGVTAAGGRVLVSGGTSELTLRAYDAEGRLGSDVLTADLGRGQPDALLDPSGSRAFVSTHTWGPYFEMDVLDVGPRGTRKVSVRDLEGSGFTAGGAKPANFPIESSLTGNLLMVASARGLDLFDVGGTGLRWIRTVDVGFKAVNVDAEEGMAVVVGSSPKPTLAFVDVSRPEQAAVLRTVPLEEGSRPTGVGLTEGTAIVAAQEKGIWS